MRLSSGLARRQNRTGYDNPVLDYARDDYYPGCDVWGIATAWQFAIADYLTDLRATVPAEWQFQQSVFGSDETATEYLSIADAVRAYSDAETIEYLTHAGRVFDRLRAQAHLAGRSY